MRSASQVTAMPKTLCFARLDSLQSSSGSSPAASSVPAACATLVRHYREGCLCVKTQWRGAVNRWSPKGTKDRQQDDLPFESMTASSPFGISLSNWYLEIHLCICNRAWQSRADLLAWQWRQHQSLLRRLDGRMQEGEGPPAPAFPALCQLLQGSAALHQVHALHIQNCSFPCF